MTSQLHHFWRFFASWEKDTESGAAVMSLRTFVRSSVFSDKEIASLTWILLSFVWTDMIHHWYHLTWLTQNLVNTIFPRTKSSVNQGVGALLTYHLDLQNSLSIKLQVVSIFVRKPTNSTWGSVSMLFSSTSNNWSCENITAATTTATSTVSLDDGGWTSPTSPSEFRRTRDPGATPIKIRNVAPPRPPPGGTPNGDGPWPPNIQLEDGLEWLPTLPNDTWKQCSWPRARQSCTLWWLLLRWPTFIRCSMWKR